MGEKEEKGRKEERKEETPAPAPAASSGGKKNLVMAAIIGGMLLAMSAVSVVVIQSLKPEDPEIIAERMKQKQEEEEREKQTKMGSVIKPPMTVVVNLAGDADRFLKAELSFEYMPKEEESEGGEGGHGGGGGGNPEITKRLPKIKDIVIDLLSSKTYDEIKDREGRRKVLSQVKNEVNKIFPEPETITNVYFESFIIQ